MNIRLIPFRSFWLTGIFLAMLVLIVVTEIRITAAWHAQWDAAHKAYQGIAEAKALANAIEQYCIDFADCKPLGNTKEWTERLAGHNPKGIRYLKVERYLRDSEGRLLDLCGSPWIIETDGSAGFQGSNPDLAESEFTVRSDTCPGFAYGNLADPHFPRFYGHRS